ncbi:ZIP zinc transporter [Tothia fuscella]|uniref:ZIP zinc transporter n=1 Tax=Tothia fuscella TaxID=1048955 RepID=A0A9P4NGA9_9PEZI|nr:ZIP zinc transporter [Tothia fuscella]
MVLDNDTRGWIMTALSGIACMLGASIICVDLIICRIPGKQDFKIQNSDAFLSSSLSLSSGVMLFSALYNMLPSAKSSLQKGGFSPAEASWMLIGLFMAGAVGIQVLSRILHHYIPSHVVDCDHTHEDEEQGHKHDHDHGHGHKAHSSRKAESTEHDHLTMSQSRGAMHQNYGTNSSTMQSPIVTTHSEYEPVEGIPRRPSFTTKVSQLVSTKKDLCDSNGECYGYTEPCGGGCFKIISNRNATRPSKTAHPPLARSASALGIGAADSHHRVANLTDVEEESHLGLPLHEDDNNYFPTNSNGHGHGQNHKRPSSHTSSSSSSTHTDQAPPPDHHHHHVPTNAFLSIGLQTSIAIALHKLPEGFITYATNHANPKLGFTVFIALFIHNITEGFAMALPLYLAINHRGKAMIWSALLGGVSQPLGAGVAAIWFKVSGKEGESPSEGVNGGMFAIVAGIMASVALQLLSQSLDLTHNRNLCIAFAFIGMGILGVSSALTA